MKYVISSALAAALLCSTALAQEYTPEKGKAVEQPKSYSPYVAQHFPQRVLFGDTRFHSSLSVDSGLIGNTLDLETAIPESTSTKQKNRGLTGAMI